ncbi:hypothetical protein BDW62DRAFT_199227 [Aspergillus aurantiobrunneus]
MPTQPPTTSNPSHETPDTATDPQKPTREAVSAFTASLHSLGANYTTDLVDRAKTLHGNSEALRTQEEQLARTTADLRRQNAEWGKIADEARNGLKEIGDVQNWAEMIERDLLVVEEVLGAVEEEDLVGDLDLDLERRGAGEGGERGDERSVGEGGGGVVLNGNAGVNGDGKRNGEEDGKGKGKGKEPEKRGWFSWWW